MASLAGGMAVATEGKSAGAQAMAAAVPKYGELVLSFATDFSAAGGAAFCVAPFITVVDRSIVQNASGAKPLARALKDGFVEAIAKPHRFIAGRDFRWIWFLYAATYTAANTIDTVSQRCKVQSGMTKFVGTTAVNMPLCILKDRAFTRMFGVIAPTSLPPIAYGLFAVRDMITIGASFVLPAMVSQELQRKCSVDKGRADTEAQLLCPTTVQLLSTPLHLLGLDLYNNRASSPSARFAVVCRNYTQSTLARMARIGPAFGVGGVGNMFLRDTLQTAAGLRPPQNG